MVLITAKICPNHCSVLNDLQVYFICKSLENVVFSCEDYKSKEPTLRCQRQWFVEDVRYIDNIQPISSLSLPLRTVLK